jgi:hypothetical protein
MKDNLLSQNIITPQEAEKLFSMYEILSIFFKIAVLTSGVRYFDYMNISLSLLDPVLYTAKQTYYRSSFLFTVSK